MAKNRFINTKFWSDSFIAELNPLDRYLFLYLLTNEHTNICGIYELPLKVMANETGIEKDMLEHMFKRLQGKVWHIEGWVYLKNFAKHQKSNESVKIGIENAKKLVPDKITNKIKELDKLIQAVPNVSTDCQQPEFESKLESEFEYESAEASSAEIPLLIKSFEEINPACKKMYGNKTQRKACKDLIENYTFNRVKMVIEKTLPRIKGMKFFPSITTPLQLFEKWSALEGAVARYQQDNNKPKWL